MRIALRWASLTIALCGSGCASHQIALHARDSQGTTKTTAELLHLIPSVDAADDPLPIQGENAAFVGVAATMADVIGGQLGPWARRNQRRRPGGWELEVTLFQDRAEVSSGRLTVELSARVTLTSTAGLVHLAQTRGYCLQTDTWVPGSTAVVDACMARMAHELAGWIEGVAP